MYATGSAAVAIRNRMWDESCTSHVKWVIQKFFFICNESWRSHDWYEMSFDSYEMSHDSYERSHDLYEMSNDSYEMSHVSGRLNRISSSCVLARGGSRTAASSHCKGIELKHLSGTVFVYNKCLHVQSYTCIHTYTIMGVVHTYTHYNGGHTRFCIISHCRGFALRHLSGIVIYNMNIHMWCANSCAASLYMVNTFIHILLHCIHTYTIALHSYIYYYILTYIQTIWLGYVQTAAPSHFKDIT